ncbi:phage holin family protein [Methylobacterium crusticola]|uniref:phage holin family protein n=1 Tax=Methylobacterium crusticola TaxID=1697972 RepID=UPI001EE377B7|nr:phage holin family protein [Methylobacterium crusticola]
MSTIKLLVQAVQQATDLATKQLYLLQLEIDGIARTVGLLCSSFGGALVMVCCGGFMFLVALVKLLAWLTGSEGLAAVIVAAPFVVAAAGLAAWGLRRMFSVGA